MHAKKEKHIHIVSAHGNRKVDIKYVKILGQGMRKECEWVRELEEWSKERGGAQTRANNVLST